MAALATGAGLWVILRRRRPRLRWLPAIAFLVACTLGATDLRAPAAGLPARWVVLDASESCSGARAQWWRWCARAAELSPGAQVGLIRVGREAEVALPLTTPEQFRAGLRDALAAPLDGSASALGLGLQRAAASSPGSDVILISDGLASDDLAAGARAVAEGGGRLFAFAPEFPLPQGAWVASLEAPSRVARGARASVRVSVAAWSPTPVELSVGPRGGPPWRRWTLTADAEPQVLLCRSPRLTAATEVEARLTVGGRDDPSDNHARARIGLEGQPRVWVVGAPLRLSGCELRQVEAGALATELGAPPDAVLLADVDARAVASAVPALRQAVEGGTALVVLGARRAFGQGGYADSPLEALLPVTSGPGSERTQPLSAAFVVDASGSMLGSARYSAAVEALPWTALRADDAVLPLAFAEASAPLGGWSTEHPKLADALRAYAQRAPGGGTDVGAALLAGLAQLAPRDGTRVLIAVTDSLDPNPERHLPALQAHTLDPAEWSVLLVRIGAEDDAALRAFARALGPAARVLAVDAADEALREALAGELAATRASLRRGAFPLTPTAEGIAAGLQPTSVSAYALVRPRPDARVLAVTADAELEPPPLACSWQLGSGTVLALPLEPAEAAAPLSQLLGGLLPESSSLELDARREGDALQVHVQGPRGPGAQVEVLAAEREPKRWPLPAGDATLELPAPPVALEVRVRDGDATLARAAVSAPREVARAGADPRALGSLCARHGGRLLAALPSELPLRANARPRSLGWLFAVLAALALLADLGWGVLAARRALRDLPGIGVLPT